MNKPIYTKDHPTTIKALFNHIASGYDKTNIAISFTLSKRPTKKKDENCGNSLSCDLCDSPRKKECDTRNKEELDE